jgi:hypothetical protein
MATKGKKNPTILQAPDLRGVIDTTKKAKLQAPDLRNAKPPVKKNPGPTPFVYLLQIQKARGPVMTWNGNRFTNNKPFKVFSRADTAADCGRKLLKEFSVLADYRVYVTPQWDRRPKGGKKQRAMRGGSKATKANPSPRANAELDQAAKRLEDFTGHKVSHLESAYSRSDQKTGLIVGELDLVGYRAKRDGKTERYGHHFKKNSRPLLAVSSDGKQLHIVGGRYEFTEAGIEDR